MIKGSEQLMPVARRDGLLIENLPAEVLVYDLDRKKAHCLNQTAALIWNHCDGKTSVGELTRLLGRDFQRPVDDEVVWLALDQLGKANLLTERFTRPGEGPRLSRRQVMRRIGLAVSVPLVVSILAPTASAALSCVGRNCVGNPGACGLCTCNGTTCV